MAISRVGTASAAATSVTIPDYLKGDLIVFWSFRNGSTTAPGTPSGFTSLSSGGANTCSDRLAYQVATADGTGVSSGTSSNATHCVVAVYRGANSVGTVSSAGSGSSTSLNYPAVTPVVGSGTSWFVGFGSHRTATDVQTAPTGMSNQTSVGSGPKTAIHDTNGGAASWSATAVTVNASSGWRSRVVEIKAAPTPKAARGMVRLIAGYTGNLFRLVRSSDSGTLDIPVNTSTGAPDLTTAGFTAWAGSDTITIDKVYDQTGNGWDLVQTASGERPLFLVSRALNGVHRAIMPFGRNFDESGSLSTARNAFSCFSVQRPWTAGYNLNCYWSFGSATFMLAGGAQAWSFNTGVWGSAEYHNNYDREQMNVFGCTSSTDGFQVFMNDNTSTLQTAQSSATLTGGWAGKSSSYDAQMDWFASLIWDQGLTQFNAEAARDDLYTRFPVDHTSTRHLVADGDSISSGIYHDNYGDGQLPTALASLGVPIQYDHIAFSGQAMADMDANRSNITGRVEGGMSRNVAYAHGGTNDIEAGTSATTIWGDATAGMLRYIRALVTAYGSNRVIIGTVLDRQWASSSAAKDTERASLNTLIRNNAATEGYLVADYATDSVLEDASNTGYFPDAVHPNKTCADRMAAILAPQLATAFGLLAPPSQPAQRYIPFLVR